MLRNINVDKMFPTFSPLPHRIIMRQTVCFTVVGVALFAFAALFPNLVLAQTRSIQQHGWMDRTTGVSQVWNRLHREQFLQPVRPVPPRMTPVRPPRYVQPPGRVQPPPFPPPMTPVQPPGRALPPNFPMPSSEHTICVCATVVMPQGCPNPNCPNRGRR